MNNKWQILKYMNSGKLFLYSATFFVVEKLFVSLAWAAEDAGVTTGDGGERSAVGIVNPLKVDSIQGLLEALLSVVIVLATPIIIFFIIYSGFLYVTARGNAEQIKQATASLTYAVIGGVIILGAFAITTIVKNLVTAF